MRCINAYLLQIVLKCVHPLTAEEGLRMHHCCQGVFEGGLLWHCVKSKSGALARQAFYVKVFDVCMERTSPMSVFVCVSLCVTSIEDFAEAEPSPTPMPKQGFSFSCLT